MEEKTHSALLKGLRGNSKEVEKLITGGIVNLEESLFPLGKETPFETQAPRTATSGEIEETPF
jgi:hypothetical protein